jgi:hypothetical protein
MKKFLPVTGGHPIRNDDITHVQAGTIDVLTAIGEGLGTYQVPGNDSIAYILKGAVVSLSPPNTLITAGYVYLNTTGNITTPGNGELFYVPAATILTGVGDLYLAVDNTVTAPSPVTYQDGNGYNVHFTRTLKMQYGSGDIRYVDLDRYYDLRIRPFLINNVTGEVTLNNDIIFNGIEHHTGAEFHTGTENHTGVETHTGTENHSGSEFHTGSESHTGVENHTNTETHDGFVKLQGGTIVGNQAALGGTKFNRILYGTMNVVVSSSTSTVSATQVSSVTSPGWTVGGGSFYDPYTASINVYFTTVFALGANYSVVLTNTAPPDGGVDRQIGAVKSWVTYQQNDHFQIQLDKVTKWPSPTTSHEFANNPTAETFGDGSWNISFIVIGFQ